MFPNCVDLGVKKERENGQQTKYSRYKDNYYYLKVEGTHVYINGIWVLVRKGERQGKRFTVEEREGKMHTKKV